MKNRMKFAQYLMLMLKVNRDNMLSYFNDYVTFLGKSHLIQEKGATSLFLECLLIAIIEDIEDVTGKGHFLENLEKMKLIWEETFFEMEFENRFSKINYELPNYEEKFKLIATALTQKEIRWLSYQYTGEVVNAPTYMTYFKQKPVLSSGGIHSVEMMGFMPNLHTNRRRINFFI